MDNNSSKNNKTKSSKVVPTKDVINESIPDDIILGIKTVGDMIKILKSYGIKIIYATNDYDQFNRLDGNRSIADNRVKKIISSVDTVGYVTSPILVNDKFEIIDGQGRASALRELGLPVEYIIEEGVGIEECIALNINQTNWTLPDYIKSYSEKGFSSFILLQKLMAEFPAANLHLLFTALHRLKAAPAPSIKDGTLVITQDEYNNARKDLKFVYHLYTDLKDIPIKGSLNVLLQAIIICYKYPNVDKKRLKNQVINKGDLLASFREVPDCVKSLGALYNDHLSAANKILFEYLYAEELRTREVKKAAKNNDTSDGKLHPYYNYTDIELQHGSIFNQ